MTYGRMDYKKIEGRMKLRKLELEAYSSVINAFRAQGNFGKDKKKILYEIRSFLSITLERHQAEIRRAINDKKLSRINSSLNGKDVYDGWVNEGRRLIPLLPRMRPKTGVSEVADSLAVYFNKKQEQEELNKVNQSNFEEQIDQNDTNKRKRANSYSIENIKKKNQENIKEPIKQQTENSTHKILNSSPVLSSITIPVSSFANSTNSSSSNSITLSDQSIQHPKLLIMSTGSMLNKQIVNNTSSNLEPSKSDSRKLSTIATIKTTQSLNELNSTQVISSQSATKVFNPKLPNSQKLMILPSSGQTKTLTIPISHNVKTLQLPSQNSTFLYQQPIVSTTSINAASIKTIPGITIQTIKTSQGNKPSNFILMPNKTTAGNFISQNNIGGAKGLLRPMNAKDFPLKIISTDALKREDDKTEPNLIEPDKNQQTIILTNVSKEGTINTSTATRNIIKTQNVAPNIIKVVSKSNTNLTSLNTSQSSPKFCISPTSNIKSNNLNVSQKSITITAGSGNSSMIDLSKKNTKLINSNLDFNTSPPKVINISQNLTNNPTSSTKTIKIPFGVSTEAISKIILNNVVSTACINSNVSDSKKMNTKIEDKQTDIDEKPFEIESTVKEDKLIGEKND